MMANNITTIISKDKEITLIGTAHVSKDSVTLVKQTIEDIQPDTVCVELDDERYNNLQNPQKWESTSLFQVIKEKKAGLLLTNIVLSSYQKRVAKKFDTTPGKEMMQGIQSAAEHSCNLVLADRNIQITMLAKIIAWTIPVAILILMGYGFFTNAQTGLYQIKAWVLWTGILAAIFTTIAFGHPLSIITAFVSAPITTLNPFLACGWFVGLVEATVRKPTVHDVDSISEDIFHIKRFFRNRFLRTLGIVVFANIGSSIGTSLVSKKPSGFSDSLFEWKGNLPISFN